jgi:hypothetical protein
MKSRRRPRGRWAAANSPDALRRRNATQDARREALALTLPPVPTGPEPLSVWQRVQVLGSDDQVLHTITLYVPTHGRCDQHAAEIDGQRCEAMLTATEIGRRVATMIYKRLSVALQAQDRWAATLCGDAQ